MPKRVGDIGFPMVVHPTRRRHGLGIPDGRLRRLAAHRPRRAAGRLCHARRRSQVAAPGSRDAARAGLVDREAPGDDARPEDPVGVYLGTTSRRSLGEPQRGRALVLPRAAPARNLRAGSRAGVMPMRVSDPESAAVLHRRARGRRRRRLGWRTVLADLDRRFPGHPLPHRRRAGPDTSAHPGLREWRPGARPAPRSRCGGHRAADPGAERRLTR